MNRRARRDPGTGRAPSRLPRQWSTSTATGRRNPTRAPRTEAKKSAGQPVPNRKWSAAMATVAEQFAEHLAAAGVKRIYGIVGDSLNGITDSIRRQGKIEWIHVRHEEVA